MKSFLALLLLSSAVLSTTSLRGDDSHQYYEIRSYVLGEKGDADAVDGYLRTALVPALGRQEIGPIGVFTNSADDETGSQRFIVVIPYDSADAVRATKAKVDADAQYQADAKEYLAHGPKDSPFQRIESELLVAMDCMPKAKVPSGNLENDQRVYELRVYESANERLGDLKVEMFNAGEVPIFLDCGIQPIFIGQAVIGPFTPSLTYLTVYPNESARGESWKAFRVHPDWSVLKEVAKYKGTVSKIHKYVLAPTSYSQM